LSPSSRYRPAPTHTQLGDEFFDEVLAADFPEHTLRYRNPYWAARVGLDTLDDERWLNHFGRFAQLPDNLSRPLSLRYHGHQFRNYNPDIGDGRGFLFAQLRDCEDDRLLDLATKGSGETPWSRSGDGRLTLKGGVREVLATALLEALGVYTSKTFSLVETGESLSRGDEPSPTRSSVMVRLGHSHIRFGSFQRQAYLEKPENIQKLVDYSIEHYYPSLLEDEAQLPIAGSRVASFLHEVVHASADLAASWMVAGFVHGVLNTDNLNITGESFDYGPYRFLPTLDPNFTAAYFDSGGLYAYSRQSEAVGWNLTRLAETMLSVEAKEPLVAALEDFNVKFNEAFFRRTLIRLGIVSKSAKQDLVDAVPEADVDFVNGLYRFLHESQIGFEQFFFDWYGGAASRARATKSPHANAYASEAFQALEPGFDRFDAIDPEALNHPYFENGQPCTLLIDEIETLWDAIAERDDWSLFEAKLDEIEQMRTALQGAR
jgi:uncharacterized protein YdiU (UPF0061 family)